ncbi:MAG: GTPase HflX, partial [Desulfovibrio sp.]|nr:GTPase HflX [Desulfovibrio sp.]
HVADAAHPDLLQQLDSVDAILADMGLNRVPRLLVLNKWDALAPAAQAELADAFPQALTVSARKGDGCRALLEELERLLLRQSAGLAAADAPLSLN